MDADQFLRIVFDQCQGVVVTCNAEEGFKARRWRPGKPLKGVVYYCISTVEDSAPRDDVLPRQAQNLVKTYAVVLDDVGTKVSRETLSGKLAPTFKLRTSMPLIKNIPTSNEQWIYVFTEGVEPARAAALVEALAQAGLTDAGARRADRIMRLPGSLNEKYSPPFATVVLEAHPDRLYTFSEVCAGLGVTPSDTPPLSAGPMALPDGMIDPIDAWNHDHDRVTGPLNARGWYPVTCPLEHEHTGQVDHGADYKPGLPGIFKCQHEHKGREPLTTAWYRAWILEQDPGADLSLVPRQALQELGTKLARALGYEPEIVEDPPGSSVGGIPPGAEQAMTQEAFKALQDQIAAGGMFTPIQDASAGLSPAQRLAVHLQAIYLDAAMLPDPDMRARDKVAPKQGTTDPRVHTVMDLIGMQVRHNMLTGRTEIRFDGYADDLGHEEAEAGMAGLIHACHRCGMSNAGAIRDAMAARAMSNCYSPVSEWICSAPWDGVSRIHALCATLTMRDSARQKWRDIAIRRWLIQTIVAIRNWEPPDAPEAVGYVLALQGQQDIGKSHWVESLMPAPWVLVGMTLHLDSNNVRDVVSRATKVPIAELGEVDSSFRRSDISAIKNFLTTKVDVYRPPYGRHDVSRARCTTFIATVNVEGFLLDPTGSRRFWPLAVIACNFKHGIDLQQLWAEAWALEASGEQYWLTAEETALHAAVVEGHAAESDVGYIVEDLALRAQTADPKKYVLANAKELTTHYRVKGGIGVYADLNALLQQGGYRRAKVRGKVGYYVPDYGTALNAAQRAAFQVIKGGLKSDENDD